MTRIWIAGALLLTPSFAAAQVITADMRGPTVKVVDISPLHIMSAEKFAAAGLDRLSPPELQVLADWVRTHAVMVGQLAAGASGTTQPGQTAGNSSVIESRIAGDFTGWDGATAFHLANGQVWQQSSFGTLRHYERSPNVTLVATPAGWRLEVENISQTIYVRRLR
jgi:hypothetical protein